MLSWGTATRLVNNADPEWHVAGTYNMPAMARPKRQAKRTGASSNDPGPLGTLSSLAPEVPDLQQSEEPELQQSKEEEEKPAEAEAGVTGAGFGFGGGGLMDVAKAATTQEKPQEDQGGDEMEEQQVVPMDGDIAIYQSTYDLEAHLAEREFVAKEETAFVTMGDVEGEMEELRADKDLDESIFADIRTMLQSLAKNTVMPERHKERPKLTPARLCEIKNRFDNDPSLRTDEADEGDKYPFEIPDNAAQIVKRSLAHTYRKIKKTNWDLSAPVQDELDRRQKDLKN